MFHFINVVQVFELYFCSACTSGSSSPLIMPESLFSSYESDSMEKFPEGQEEVSRTARVSI